MGVADKAVVPEKSGNTDGGKGLWSGSGVGSSEREGIDDESGNSG